MLNEFQKHLIHQDRSERTVRGYLADLKAFSTWFQQRNSTEFAPENITPGDIRNFRQFMLVEKKVKPASINRKLASISAFLNWAVADGQININPSFGIRAVRPIKDDLKYLDYDEQKALKKIIEKEIHTKNSKNTKYHTARQRDALLILFLLNTGLRLGEALMLKLEDVEMEDQGRQIMVGKNGVRNQRFVPLNRAAFGALQEWLTLRPKCNTDYVWVATNEGCNRALSGRSVQRSIARIGIQAGIPDTSPHVLRHTFGRNLVIKGVGIEVVSKLLGHSNLSSTLIYIAPEMFHKKH